MKKITAFVLIFMMMLTVCSKPENEIPVGEKPKLIETDISSSEPEKKEEKFFPAAGAYMEYGPSYIRGRTEWNSDNTFTFQHENTVNTVSSENEIIKSVSLPKEHLPEDGGYILSWNEKYILAIDKQIESSWNRFGVAGVDESGKVFLANVVLFDREGNFIREYYKGDVYGYDENNNYEVYLPVMESSEYPSYSYLADGDKTYWIDEDKVIFNCHLYVIYYDFSKDEGKIIDDMGEYMDKYGKFSVYYGADDSQCSVLDGDFYYLAYKNDEKANSAGTIWKANENGSEELFGGKEFMHLFVGREILIAVEEIDGNFHENGSIVYAIDPKELELNEIFRGNAGFPFGDDGKIRFENYYSDLRILYSYDYRTGEFTEEPLEQGFSVESLVPGYRGYIMKSLDGKYFVEYDFKSEEPRLRIMPCE